jgi:hypothetical protein
MYNCLCQQIGGGTAPLILNIGRVSGKLHAPASLPLGKNASTLWKGVWVGPKASPYAFEKRKSFAVPIFKPPDRRARSPVIAATTVTWSPPNMLYDSGIWVAVAAASEQSVCGLILEAGSHRIQIGLMTCDVWRFPQCCRTLQNYRLLGGTNLFRNVGNILPVNTASFRIFRNATFCRLPVKQAQVIFSIP